MPTTNSNFSTLITAIDTKAQSLAASTTDAKDLVFLGKAIEALNIPSTVSAVIAEGDTQVGLVTTEGQQRIVYTLLVLLQAQVKLSWLMSLYL